MTELMLELARANRFINRTWLELLGEVPFAKLDGERARRAISRLKASRKGRRLGGLSWKGRRDEGRQGQTPS